MSHAQILDRREPLGKPLIGSVAAHIAIGGAFLASYVLRPHVDTFGEKIASSGSVGISVTKTIPSPQREGRENRLAHDTQSVVPQAPSKKREIVKEPPPDPRAIPLPSRNPVKKVAPQASTRDIYKPQPLRPNQLPTTIQESMKAPQYAMQGAGGVGIGENSQLGNHFGYYVNLMRNQIASKWNTGGMANDGRRVLLNFSIMRDGTVEGVRVAQASGNYALDTSAQRAVMEASPLPPLPPGYQQNSAQVELWFQVK